MTLWLLTGVAGLLLQDLLMPQPAPWRDIGTVSYIGILAATNLLAMMGLVITARIAGSHAEGATEPPVAEELRQGVQAVVPYLLTAVLTLLRILLVILGSLPLVLLIGFLLYGAAQGALSESVEMALVAAPILLFAVVGFARFGWAVYFTLLHGASAPAALRKSKSLFAHNRRTVWILTGLVLAPPVLISALPYLTVGRVPAFFRGLSYLTSLWSFAVTALAATVIAGAREESE